ncbi:hypothetical protein [Oceanicola sp. S124]|uniref:hypothetical protein n=1 Tax=Oceanicola sp. S124 TaxID=1042378 RepID=UPI0002558942|nr:hypothetical protein [Oceanicola sp. S124]
MRDAEGAEHSRVAVAVTALLQHPDQLAETRDWYAAHLGGVDLTKQEAPRLATTFLAAEGAFLLRAFGLLSLPEAQWKALFDDVLSATATDLEGAEPENG